MYLALALVLGAPPSDLAPPRLVGEGLELKTATGTLYGTLDLPPTPGPWPVVLIHAGSGPTDRDGNGPLTRTNNLKMVGRALAAEGIAVVRIDKRGIAASAKALAKEEDARIDTYAADVVAWTNRLRHDGRFTKIGYIGHSEGGLIGLVAAKEAKFDALVSLCGPGRPLQEVLREQLKKNLPDDLYTKSDALMTELEAGRTVKDAPKELAALFRPSVQPFLISVFQHDPAKLAAGVRAPFLIVSASTDIQVSAEDAKRLGAANANARVVTIDGMNHVLKAVEKTDRPAQLPSYFDPALPLHPKLLPALVEFLNPALRGK
ncbi:alpha/beta hydrolase family protein [Frigoriglobus tundricola]|uniref:Hydrolase, alpha/beta fold family n=1 Tax=Frigoriglobus tundricola TaxID=2774151 RepID=A0A6M5YVX2_9BACT|nr:alpha/beta fold hydrolase [Frigoriglobus tundricola]QJW97546.1 Hydrolase, alpha/beta fold family [Frigoriglobus tundricola]